MDFYEILDQVIDLLKQRGRASYRALQVLFTLDDALLEALGEELLYAYPVVDDAGKGLIWTGVFGPPLAPDRGRSQARGIGAVADGDRGSAGGIRVMTSGNGVAS